MNKILLTTLSLLIITTATFSSTSSSKGTSKNAESNKNIIRLEKNTNKTSNKNLTQCNKTCCGIKFNYLEVYKLHRKQIHGE